jgi:hypothetical protein
MKVENKSHECIAFDHDSAKPNVRTWFHKLMANLEVGFQSALPPCHRTNSWDLF